MAKKVINANQEVLGTQKITNVPNTAGDIVNIDAQGNITKRTAAETLTDIGAAPSSHIHNFVFEQVTPAQVWSITHNLGKYPSVIVVDSAKTVVLGQIDFVDVNNVTLNFNSEFTGFAYFN